MAIEIERRFLIPSAVHLILERFGATLLKKVRIRDVYYDNNKFILTKNDFWLRQRTTYEYSYGNRLNTSWQLKKPVKEMASHTSHTSHSKVSIYEEIENDLNQIMQSLSKIDQLGIADTYIKNINNEKQNCHDLLSISKNDCGIEMIAMCDFITDRFSFAANNDLSLDFDFTNIEIDNAHCYNILEIEKMTQRDTNISSNVKQETNGLQLFIHEMEKICGTNQLITALPKIYTYLFLKNKPAFQVVEPNFDKIIQSRHLFSHQFKHATNQAKYENKLKDVFQHWPNQPSGKL